ncbi:hypothetical protein QBC38DRAFT_482185 [Podospora fimiseda]|uniref:Uncharacterized protein n=1 Tax=Podospora fimiseda TaxID=252190 RepID=A0AAN7BLY8_9PEZI|nr:hypothetical protein QBC38DRAFT_482185 [Podospora fimiseda]
MTPPPPEPPNPQPTTILLIIVILLPILLYLVIGLFLSQYRFHTPWVNNDSSEVQEFVHAEEKYPLFLRKAVEDAAASLDKGNYWVHRIKGVFKKVIWHFGWATVWPFMLLWDFGGRDKSRRSRAVGQESGGDGGGSKRGSDELNGYEGERREEEDEEWDKRARILIKRRPGKQQQQQQQQQTKRTTTMSNNITTDKQYIVVERTRKETEEEEDTEQDDEEEEDDHSSSDESFDGELLFDTNQFTVNPLGISYYIPERGAFIPFGNRKKPVGEQGMGLFQGAAMETEF